MAKDTGWIRLYRSSFNNRLYFSEPFTRWQAWCDLLLLANHKSGMFRVRGIKVEVLRGQTGFSAVELADRWRWSRGKVNRFLVELKDEHQIVQQKNNVTTLISIVNYEKYQTDGTQNDTLVGTQNEHKTVHQTVHQTDINKNDNKNKNEENDNKTRKDRDAPNVPLFETVHRIFIQQGGTIDMAKAFFGKYEALEWRLNNSPIKDFSKLIPSYVQTWKNNERNGTKRTNGSTSQNGSGLTGTGVISPEQEYNPKL